MIDHIGFPVSDYRRAKAFYATAMAAGGRDNGAPAIRATITPIITAPSCSIPTATTSKP
jgi:predicted enzyme related to lactoylglutathione lyase